MYHAFLYISLLSLHDYDGKMPNFTFSGRRFKTSDSYQEEETRQQNEGGGGT